MSTIGGTETFQLTIRCAMQSFPDHNLECPAEWSVLQLKKHLAQECVTKPDPSRQRLIYAGHCLDNEQKVRDVLAKRRDGIVRNEVAEKQVIHMVYIGGKSSENRGAQANPAAVSASIEGVRHRGNNGQQNSSAPANMAAPHNPQQQQPSAFVPQQQQQYFAAFPSQQQQQSYDAWMTAYQNYMTQMAQIYQQMPYASAAQMGQQQQAYTFFGGSLHSPLAVAPHFNPGHHHQPHAQMVVVPQQRQPPQQRGAAGDAPVQQQQRMGAEEAPGVAAQADLLDIVYKSVRFALLAMVLYVYSSLERFFLVLAVVAFFWFVHRRRNQQHRDNAAPENDAVNVMPPAAAGDDYNNNMTENDQPEAGEPPVEAVQQATSNGSVAQQPSAWNVFFTVLQSFFTSLVPNPMPAPMDIN